MARSDLLESLVKLAPRRQACLPHGDRGDHRRERAKRHDVLATALQACRRRMEMEAEMDIAAKRMGTPLIQRIEAEISLRKWSPGGHWMTSFSYCSSPSNPRSR